MGSSELEKQINLYRGWACTFITLASVVIVLADPTCLLFWHESATVFNPTGWPGLILSSAFLAYLGIDTVVSFACRHQFRRSLGAVYVHHAAVGVGVLAFLLPSPPRGFFLYVWGEALTACRVLPPKQRWMARNFIFAFRRLLWSYLLVRDTYLFPQTSLRQGAALSLIPLAVALLLLGLDAMWWAEHTHAARKDQAPATMEAEKLLAIDARLAQEQLHGTDGPPTAEIPLTNVDSGGLPDVENQLSCRLSSSRSSQSLANGILAASAAA